MSLTLLQKSDLNEFVERLLQRYRVVGPMKTLLGYALDCGLGDRRGFRAAYRVGL